MLFIRSLIFYTLYSAITIIFGLISLLLMLLPKAWAAGTIVYWNLTILYLLKLCCNINYEVSGEIKNVSQPYVLVANHQCPWETLFLQWYFRPISAVLKKQLLSIPFFGWGLKVTQPIAIDRSQPTQALRQIKALGLERLSQKRNVLIFPEGTRNAPNHLGSYMRSAADVAKQAEVSIIPVVHNAGNFWLDKSFIKQPGTIKVVIGEPITIGDKKTKQVMLDIHQWTENELLKMNHKR